MEIKNLNKNFNKKTVFNNFSANIPDNKITFIMGESGSGKTTLLRIILGLDNDYNGKIISSHKKISCVFQEPRLLPALTVEENLKIIEKGASLSLNEILDIVELSNDKNKYPSELSGGMKMRLALARAIYYNGDLFILDEPFSALDEKMKERIIPKIFNLIKNKTVIIVSHSMDDAEKYGDKIIKI